jgi:hypothetical protein
MGLNIIKKNNGIKTELKLNDVDLPIVVVLENKKQYILKLTNNGKLILNKKE